MNFCQSRPLHRRLALLVVLCVSLGGCGAERGAPAPSAPVLPDPLVAKLDGLLKECVEGIAGNPLARGAPGAILLVDTPQGRYLKAAGVASLATKRPLAVGDPMQIGSNTKMFTGVLLLRLQEAGKLSLDDKLSMWLPELARRLPHGEQMTLRQLATHTSGASDYGDDIIGGGLPDASQLVRGYTPLELVEYAIDHGEPDFEPGAPRQWHYSNTGYILLGMVLEKAAGVSYDALLRQEIFQPLGMSSAVLESGSPPEDAPVHGYYEHAKGIDTTRWNLSQGWAAGAIVCTAEDLAKFGHALLDGSCFRKPATLQLMRAFYRDSPGLVVALCKGYGIGLQELDDGVLGHRGQTLGFNSILMVIPELQTVALALTNDAVGPSMLVQVRLPALLQAETPTPEPAGVGGAK